MTGEMAFSEVVLTRMRRAIKRVVTDEQALVTSEVRMDHMMNRWVVALQREVLAQQLPPAALACRTTTPRHASWWDTFKATHRGRWWWPAVLSTVRYTDEPVTVIVNVRAAWTFPEATILRHDDRFGAPVMVATWDVEVHDER